MNELFFIQKKRPQRWGPFELLPEFGGETELNSSLQYPLDRRHPGHFPVVPHLIDHLLDVGEVLFLKVIEPALFGEKILNRNSSLTGLARVPGVNDVPVDDFVQRVYAAFDSQLAKLV